jgi:hypothetical protein
MNIIGNIINNLIRGDEGGRSGRIVQIGDNNYIFDVYLWNGETKSGVTFGSIEEFQIVDDLRYFYSYGYLLINDTNSVRENFEGIAGKETVPYNFRGDGRDYLYVEIMPQMKENDQCVNETSEEERREFCLRYVFSIYKIEEEMREDRGVKFKRLHFWDTDYQLLSEIDSHFSTSEVPFEENSFLGFGFSRPSNTDDSRKYTGDSIKYLLDKCLNGKNNVGSRTGFIASNEWDRGAGLLEYHGNSSYKAIDDLQYLLQYHVSELSYGAVPCILKKTRYTEEYTLLPITVYLENSLYNTGGLIKNLLGGVIRGIGGRNLTEDMFLGKLDTTGKDMGSVLNYGSRSSPNSFNAINYNLIENYSFIKPDADMIQRDMSTHFIHSYDPEGFFTCSVKAGNIESINKGIYDFNIKKLPNFFGSKQGSNILPTNQLRRDNKNVQHVYTSGLGVGENFQKNNFGRNKAIMASVFKNTGLYFRARGLTRRKSGTFFNVNRMDNQISNDHDNMLLGTYFATMVIHEFKKGMYYNHIYATKSSTSKQHKFADLV